MASPVRPHVVILDPAVHTPEVECFNKMSQLSSLPLTYHLPALYGPTSFPQTYEGIAGVIVMGSASSVKDGTEWQQRMNEWLQGCFQRKIPIFGICYGHQLIAHLFGGKVDYLNPERTKCLGFRKVGLLPNPLWGNRKMEGSLFISHCESVISVPPELIVTAASPEVPIEGLMHAELPIWSFQPHPEAGPHYAVRRNLTYATHEEAFSFGHSLVKAFLDFCAGSGRTPL